MFNEGEENTSKKTKTAGTIEDLVFFLMSIDDSEFDQWRLNKLAYYVVGHYMAITDEILIEQPEFRPIQYGWASLRIRHCIEGILDSKNRWILKKNIDKKLLTKNCFNMNETTIIKDIYMMYSAFFGDQLVDKCHSEPFYYQMVDKENTSIDDIKIFFKKYVPLKIERNIHSMRSEDDLNIIRWEIEKCTCSELEYLIKYFLSNYTFDDSLSKFMMRNKWKAQKDRDVFVSTLLLPEILDANPKFLKKSYCWRLAFCSKHGNPLAQYHLSKAISNYMDEQKLEHRNARVFAKYLLQLAKNSFDDEIRLDSEKAPFFELYGLSIELEMGTPCDYLKCGAKMNDLRCQKLLNVTESSATRKQEPVNNQTRLEPCDLDELISIVDKNKFPFLTQFEELQTRFRSMSERYKELNDENDDEELVLDSEDEYQVSSDEKDDLKE